jgi:hypothetical protein
MESKVSGGTEWRSFNLAVFENSTKVYSTQQRLKIGALLPIVVLVLSIIRFHLINFLVRGQTETAILEFTENDESIIYSGISEFSCSTSSM